jgi:hypothetical protein
MLGSIVYRFRKRWDLGFLHWYAENVVWKKILDWQPNPNWPLSPVPVHFLTSIHDWRMALWMLVSLHETTQRRWQITLHDDGSLMATDLEHFRRIFPGIRILRPRNVEERMAKVLSDFPRCRDYRNRMPHGLKCFDIPEFCEAPRYLMIDPDVLFFRPPLEIINWVENSADSSCWFNRDFQEPSPLPPAQAMADFGVPLWPCVNSGLCLLQRDVVRDLDSMEKWLGHPALQIPKMQWRVEQTLLALCASKVGKGGLLPTEYEVSPNKNRLPTGISRHYIGCVRDRFYSEGILEVCKRLNLERTSN